MEAEGARHWRGMQISAKGVMLTSCLTLGGIGAFSGSTALGQRVNPKNQFISKIMSSDVLCSVPDLIYSPTSQNALHEREVDAV